MKFYSMPLKIFSTPPTGLDSQFRLRDNPLDTVPRHDSTRKADSSPAFLYPVPMAYCQ